VALSFGLIPLCAFILMSNAMATNISLEDARKMAEKASRNSDFPIVVNTEVVIQLNKFVNSETARNTLRDSLQRKKEYKSMLSRAADKYNNPEELNAIPLVESGYKNLASKRPVHPAGLWMFIPATARRFGITVRKGRDERLNATKETDAAHRYLLANKLIFNDWLLAILSYNIGETSVVNGIKKYKTRDPWELSKYVKGDKDYMAKVMASIIIMKNPKVLN
jgi:membrane-bound lytic murein transglycosylase D